MNAKNSLTSILEGVCEEDGDGRITLGEIMDGLQRRGFGPLILVPSLLIILPTGFIPGVQSLCALLIIMISAQLLMGRKQPWLPNRLKRVSFGRKRFCKVVNSAKPITERMDSFTARRFSFLTKNDAMKFVVAGISLILAIAILLIFYIPLLPILLALPILFFALSITVHDGILLVLGFVTLGAAIAAGPYFLG